MTKIKLLILSDSHGNVSRMLDAAEREAPDTIIHLGDMIRDAQELSRAYPNIPLESVSGNCDGWTAIPPERELTIDNVRFLIGHGHTWKVKSGMDTALCTARGCGADILLYGHTHSPVCYRQGNLWVMNPGTVLGGRSDPSYGVIELKDGAISCELRSF